MLFINLEQIDRRGAVFLVSGHPALLIIIVGVPPSRETKRMSSLGPFAEEIGGLRDIMTSFAQEFRDDSHWTACLPRVAAYKNFTHHKLLQVCLLQQ